MVDQADQFARGVVEVIGLDGQLAVLVAVDGHDLVGVVVGEIDFCIDRPRHSRPRIQCSGHARTDYRPERVVGVVVHEVGRAVDGGRHLRAMDGRDCTDSRA